MKTKPKTNPIAKLALLLALMATAVPAAQAQEFIREVINHDDEYSIVHEYKKDYWLVYNYYHSKSVFSMITETGTATQQLFFGYLPESDSLKINDFKIFNDTVYFCGQVWYNDYSHAVWGYFPLSGFPNVIVQSRVRPYHLFDKLEVFSVDSTMKEIHVVIKGVASSNNGVVIDEIRTAPDVFTEYDVQSNFVMKDVTDLIQTDNYIVLSVCSPNTPFLHSSYLLSFLKPTTTGTTIFSSSAYKTVLFDPNPLGVMLEHCIGDAMAVVEYNGSSCFVTGLLSPLSYYSTIVFELKKFAVRDVCYNRDSKELDILRTSATDSYIYHISSIMAMAGGTVPIYHYPEDQLNSLDYLTTMPDFFIASGHDAERLLRVYRYRCNFIQTCLIHLRIECEKLTIPWKPVPIEVDYDYLDCEMLQWNTYPYENPIEPICD